MTLEVASHCDNCAHHYVNVMHKLSASSNAAPLAAGAQCPTQHQAAGFHTDNTMHCSGEMLTRICCLSTNRVGTHPSGASVIPAKTPAAAAQGTLSLECWLERHPEALGRVLAERRAVGQLTGRLPFLMKVGGRCAGQFGTPVVLS